VTGWGQDDDKEKANAAGFDRHFTKPVNPQQVEEVLVEFLQERALSTGRSAGGHPPGLKSNW
jgi:CheY-like chemotaxis protein